MIVVSREPLARRAMLSVRSALAGKMRLVVVVKLARVASDDTSLFSETKFCMFNLKGECMPLDVNSKIFYLNVISNH